MISAGEDGSRPLTRIRREDADFERVPGKLKRFVDTGEM